jgi:hypothetical protein
VTGTFSDESGSDMRKPPAGLYRRSAGPIKTLVIPGRREALPCQELQCGT